jgi:polyhydroxyalkanoate synthesis regulator phasin
MVKDALRGYLSLASGLSEITAARARSAARSLVEQGEATAGQVSALAEDLVATSRRNRESLLLLVRHEVEQAVRRLGVGASSDVETLTTRVRELERTVRELRAARSGHPSGAPAPAVKKTRAAKKTAAKKTGKSSRTVSG